MGNSLIIKESSFFQTLTSHLKLVVMFHSLVHSTYPVIITTDGQASNHGSKLFITASMITENSEMSKEVVLYN